MLVQLAQRPLSAHVNPEVTAGALSKGSVRLATLVSLRCNGMQWHTNCVEESLMYSHCMQIVVVMKIIPNISFIEIIYWQTNNSIERSAV